MARTSKTMLNKNGESRHPHLVSDLRENVFSFSLLSVMLVLVLSYVAFIRLRYVSSIPTSWRVFVCFFFCFLIINGCQKLFLHQICDMLSLLLLFSH